MLATTPSRSDPSPSGTSEECSATAGTEWVSRFPTTSEMNQERWRIPPAGLVDVSFSSCPGEAVAGSVGMQADVAPREMVVEEGASASAATATPAVTVSVTDFAPTAAAVPSAWLVIQLPSIFCVWFLLGFWGLGSSGGFLRYHLAMEWGKKLFVQGWLQL